MHGGTWELLSSRLWISRSQRWAKLSSLASSLLATSLFLTLDSRSWLMEHSLSMVGRFTSSSAFTVWGGGAQTQTATLLRARFFHLGNGSGTAAEDTHGKAAEAGHHLRLVLQVGGLDGANQLLLLSQPGVK